MQLRIIGEMWKMNANVTQLKPVAKPKANTKGKAEHRNTVQSKRRIHRQMSIAVGTAFVGCILTALSLTHLAHGIEIVTHAPMWEAIALGVGLDVGFLAMELAQVMASTDTIRKAISRFTKPAIICTLAGSAAMNAFAFASQTTGWYVYVAIVLGVAINALIFATMRVSVILYIDCQNRT